MAETPKLKKTGFWFFDHKRVNFQYFQKQKKSSIIYSFIPSLYMSYNSLAQKVLPRQYSVDPGQPPGLHCIASLHVVVFIL